MLIPKILIQSDLKIDLRNNLSMTAFRKRILNKESFDVLFNFFSNCPYFFHKLVKYNGALRFVFYHSIKLAWKMTNLFLKPLKRLKAIMILVTNSLLFINALAYLFSYNLFGDFVENLAKPLDLFLKRSLNNYEIGPKLISFSNNNFIVTEHLTNEIWVLRVPYGISNLLSDRKQEKEVLEWAYRQRFSTLEVKSFDIENGYLLTKFLSGRSSSSEDFLDESRLKNALNLLHRLHSSKNAPITVTFQPLKRFFMTSKEAENYNLFLPTEVYELATLLIKFLSQIPISCFHFVPCHNDPSPENFFYQDGVLFLHDWELAGMNDPMWDLAHLSVIAKITPEKILSFYRSFDPLALEKMIFFRPFILFNTLVWASLERQQSFSFLPLQTSDLLYKNFLEEIDSSIKSSTFQVSFQKLVQGGCL